MKLQYINDHENCDHNISNNEIGFKIVTPKQGDIYQGKKPLLHTIVFLLEGEVDFSYNEFHNYRFRGGDIFLLPHASEMYSKALTDCKILVLSFDNEIESYCDSCTMSSYRRSDADMEYEFKPLKINGPLHHFCDLMIEYLNMDIKCKYIHHIKQKELLILLRHTYTKAELVRFFLPMIGASMSFRNRLFRSYQDGLSVKELAGRFNMSEPLFSDKFKQEFGLSPYQWMLKQKNKHILLRLSIPETTLSDIIRDFKFTDSSHLLKYCKKHFGCTPLELTARMKNK